MDENESQTIFERRFSDFEKLVDIKKNETASVWKSLDYAMIAKSESLAKYTVYAAEGSNLRDIERLISLRSSLNRVVHGQTMRWSRTTCLDVIIQRKIRFLVDSEPRKFDLDPLDVLKRLTSIQGMLPFR